MSWSEFIAKLRKMHVLDIVASFKDLKIVIFWVDERTFCEFQKGYKYKYVLISFQSFKTHTKVKRESW